MDGWMDGLHVRNYQMFHIQYLVSCSDFIKQIQLLPLEKLHKYFHVYCDEQMQFFSVKDSTTHNVLYEGIQHLVNGIKHASYQVQTEM